MPDANIRAVITAKDEASAALKKFGDNANSTGDKIAGVAKAASVALLAAGAAAVGFGVLSVKAYEDSENKLAQLNAVLQSTGGVAGVTAQAAIDLSKALQKTTKFSDEEVLSAENLLLTFTSIGKDIFPQATKTVLNMATALGEDTKSASIQLGKALQDPILGITALRRVGVNFNDAQKKVIENLVETGHKAEAQKAILKELETEFGNSAEAAGNTFAGKLAHLKNALNDVEETIGHVIVNGLAPLATKALEALASIDWEKVINRSSKALSELWKNQLLPLAHIVSDVANRIANFLHKSFEALENTITGKVFPALRRLTTEVLLPLAAVAGGILVIAIRSLIDIFNATLRVISFLTTTFLNHKGAVLGLATAFGILIAAMKMDAVITAFSLQMAFARQAVMLLQMDVVSGASKMVMGLQTIVSFLQSPWAAAFILAGVVVGAVTAHLLHQQSQAEQLRTAQQNLTTATDSLRDAQNRLSGASLNLQGAQLAVEGAQRAYNQAVQQFGPNSFEARLALHNLEVAQQQVKDATNQTKQAQDELLKKQQEVARDQSLVKHLQSIVGNLDNLSGSAREASAKMAELNSINSNFKVPDVSAFGNQIKFQPALNPPKRAAGGPVSGGSTYMVGEEGPELFIPRQSGQIIPNKPSQSITENNSHFNLSVNVGVYAGSQMEKRKLAEDLMNAYQDLMSARGMA